MNTVQNIVFFKKKTPFLTEESFADWEINSVELLCKNLSVTWTYGKSKGNSQNNE